MPETERKLHILTPLLWPSRCVFIVLLMLGSTPSGLSEGPSVWCSLPYHISSLTLWESAGNCFGGFPSAPLGRVWLSLPHLVSTVWNSTDNWYGGFRGPPRSGVAFPTTSGLYCLEFDWQLLWDPNSTELNNNSTPTRSPTGSLKSNV